MRNPFSLLSWYLHGRLRRDVALLESLHYEPDETIRERKMASLRQLVRHAIESVPFYRELYLKAGVAPQDLKTFEDLKHLPCVKKEDFRKAPMEDRVSRNAPVRRMRRAFTSGSTGEPFSFYIDLEGFLLDTAAHNLYQVRAGWRPGERLASIRTRFEGPRFDSLRQPVKRVLGMDTIRLYCQDLDPVSVPKAMDRLISAHVTLLQGPGSSLCTLARQWENRRPTPIRSVISFAEMLLESDARRISEAFGAEVFRDYGMAECMRVGFECGCHDGYHVDPLRCIAETRPDENGREEIVVTNLTNRVHPFIRYRVGDLGQMNFDPCPCGRRTPRIVNIGGRVFDVIRTPQGKELSLHVLTMPFREFENAVDLWQVRQVSETEIDVWVEATGHFNDAVASRLIEHMEASSDGTMKVRVRRVDHVPLGKNGKRDRVLSKERLAAMQNER